MIDQYAVIGNPISHSLSPTIHRQFADRTNQSMQYTLLECACDDFEKALETFIANGGLGVNVTLPFKERAFKIADICSQRATQAQAANALCLRDGRLLAENFDGLGFAHDLSQHQYGDVTGKTVLIMGAGGAVRGILGPLIDRHPQKIYVSNRSFDKAELLAKEFSVTATALDEIAQPVDIIINGTSLGVSGEVPFIPPALMTKNTFCYDLMYDCHNDTAFVTWAKSHGASAADGLGMLVEQAALSFEWWRGVKPPSKAILQTLRC